MAYRETSLFQLAFAPKSDGQDEARDRLRQAFEAMRHRVGPLADDVKLSVPGYTDHSLVHCDALWETASIIAGESYPLNPLEAFVLGAAFLTHDLGMGLAAYPGGLPAIAASVEWLDHLAQAEPQDFEALNVTFIEDVTSNPTWNGLTSIRVKEILTIFLREHHARTAEKIISQSWLMSNDQIYYLLEDAELRALYGRMIGLLGRSHWEGVDDLLGLLGNLVGAPAGYPTEWSVNGVKLACLLRTADAAQLDARRASITHTPIRLPQGESLTHWAFQERLMAPFATEGRLHITSGVAFELEHAGAWWLAYDNAQMIDDELRAVDTLLADLGLPRFEVRGVAGISSPHRFSQYVPVQNWEPVDVKPRINNSVDVISKLGGISLYGKRQEFSVAVREILANAVDASRLLRKAVPDMEPRPISVTLIRNPSGTYELAVKDSGIGMTRDDISRYLLDFGTSGWRSSTTKKNWAGALSGGFSPTGQYGIGFFSVFMLSDQVTVISRSAGSGPDETSIVTFDAGLKERPLLRSASKAERMYESGTQVICKFDVEKLPNYLHAFDVSDRQSRIASELADLVVLSGERFSFYIEGGEMRFDFSDADWRTCSNLKLYEMLTKNYSHRPWLVDEGDKAQSEFIDRVRPLSDESGKVIARLAFMLPWERGWSPQSISFIWGACYIGGIRVHGLFSCTGVLEGESDTAARREISKTIPLAEMQRWFDDQVQLLRARRALTSDDQIELFAVGASLDMALQDLHCCFSAQGPMDLRAMRTWVSEQEDITLLLDPLHPVKSERDGHLFFDIESSLLFSLPEDALGFGEESDLTEIPFDSDVNYSTEIGEQHMRNPEGFYGDDLGVWWSAIRLSSFGQVIRAISQVWGRPLGELLSAAKFKFDREDPDECVALASRSGDSEVKLSGLTLRRKDCAGDV